YKEMSINGWKGARDWKKIATTIAPTLVGGSKKHGGPDLGPTRAKKAWQELGIDGMGIANEPPAKDHIGMPRLTVKMAAIIQGFPSDWSFVGAKTPAYRQVGNAFPAPVAKAVGLSIRNALQLGDKTVKNKAAVKPKVEQLELI
ncbi:MAG: DNA cytosine methyltransferase, partial [Pseudobdellovibrio sp.]